MPTILLPMPGDSLGADTVIASCWQNDTGDSPATATVLLMQPSAPFYVVVDLEHNGDEWMRTEAYSFPNIIPASEFYSETIGGY